ncbi:MAG: carbonic anhydrase family protein [Reyranellaceae bacterium]
MISRRYICGSLALAVPFVAGAARAQAPECQIFTKDRQTATTPAEALARLKAGNERFVAGKSINCDLMAQVRATATGQAPYACIVGCIDSRVPPELVFDQRLGDVFTARIAGNFVNTDIIGSLEFGTKLVGARLIVVLGHSDCGAIKGAIDGAELGLLTATLANIKPAVKANASYAGDKTSKNTAFVQAVADSNAKLAARMLTDRSAVLKGLVDAKQLLIVAAMHDLSTGKVSFFA